MASFSSLATDRRRFLRLGGVVAGLTAGGLAFGNQLWERSVPQANHPLTIGVLLPEARVYSDVVQQAFLGMQLYAKQFAQRNLEFIVQHVGTTPYAIRQGAESLLAQGKIDVLTGLVSPNAFPLLQSTLEQANTLLVAADVGADMIRLAQAHPMIYSHSLGYWQANYALGRLAAKQLGTRAVLLSSFYETGFDALFALRHGFEQAGGTITQLLVSHRPIDPNGYEQQLVQQIKQDEADFVFVLGQGRDAQELLQALGQVNRLPVLVSSFAASEGSAAIAGVSELPTIFPWTHNLAIAENQEFTTAYANANQQAATSAALLGFETLQALDMLTAPLGAQVHQPKQLQTILPSLYFRGPRGEYRFDSVTQSTIAPLFIGTAQAQDSQFQYKVYDTLALPDYSMLPLTDIVGTTKSGWSSAYCCH